MTETLENTEEKKGEFPNREGRAEMFTPQQIMDAYKQAMGFKSTAAKHLGCTVKTLTNYEKRYPEIREYWLHEVKYKRDDFVEGKLMSLINYNNVATSIFYA